MLDNSGTRIPDELQGSMAEILEASRHQPIYGEVFQLIGGKTVEEVCTLRGIEYDPELDSQRKA